MNSLSPHSCGRVTVVGTLNVDLVWQVPALPRPGQTILASTVQQLFGGKGANQAVAAARQGAAVTLVGAVGNDAEGRLYREHLAREGVDVSLISTAADVATGTAHVYVDSAGENVIVVNRGANERLDPTSLVRVLQRTDVLMVQLECALPAAVEALRLAQAHGVRSVLNASPTNAAFPWGTLTIDTVIVNEHECGECFAHRPAELIALSTAARRALLLDYGVRHLVVTQGAEPTVHVTADDVHTVPTLRVEPRDTVGAGDMFAGALAAELAVGRGWESALRHANAAAALSTLALGAQAAMPYRSDVDAAIARTEERV
jgi:ribokinase